MNINHAILHILDFNSDVCVYSQEELDFSSLEVCELVEKRLLRITTDEGREEGTYTTESPMPAALTKYKDDGDFISLSTNLAERIHDSIARSEDPVSTDVLVVHFSQDEDGEYLAVILMENKSAFTHRVTTEGDKVRNDIIRHHSILPGLTQQVQSFALMNLDGSTVSVRDKKRRIDGETAFLLKDEVIFCYTEVSAKEAVRVVRKIAGTVADDFGGNSALALSKGKQYLVENAETSPSFSPTEMGQAMFAGSDSMRQAYEERLQEANLPDSVPLEHEFAIKTGRMQRIKTDTGIEIVVPAAYLSDPDFVEFIQNDDGTLSIAIKKIGKLTNR